MVAHHPPLPGTEIRTPHRQPSTPPTLNTAQFSPLQCNKLVIDQRTDTTHVVYYFLAVSVCSREEEETFSKVCQFITGIALLSLPHIGYTGRRFTPYSVSS